MVSFFVGIAHGFNDSITKHIRLAVKQARKRLMKISYGQLGVVQVMGHLPNTAWPC
jgi:ribosomal protein S5